MFTTIYFSMEISFRTFRQKVVHPSHRTENRSNQPTLLFYKRRINFCLPTFRLQYLTGNNFFTVGLIIQKILFNSIIHTDQQSSVFMLMLYRNHYFLISLMPLNLKLIGCRLRIKCLRKFFGNDEICFPK